MGSKGFRGFPDLCELILVHMREDMQHHCLQSVLVSRAFHSIVEHILWDRMVQLQGFQTRSIKRWLTVVVGVVEDSDRSTHLSVLPVPSISNQIEGQESRRIVQKIYRVRTLSRIVSPCLFHRQVVVKCDCGHVGGVFGCVDVWLRLCWSKLG